MQLNRKEINTPRVFDKSKPITSLDQLFAQVMSLSPTYINAQESFLDVARPPFIPSRCNEVCSQFPKPILSKPVSGSQVLKASIQCSISIYVPPCATMHPESEILFELQARALDPILREKVKVWAVQSAGLFPIERSLSHYQISAEEKAEEIPEFVMWSGEESLPASRY
jgi:hypothetical protein